MIFVVTTSELEKGLIYEPVELNNEIIETQQDLISSQSESEESSEPEKDPLNASTTSDVIPGGFFKRSRRNILISSSDEEENNAATLDKSIREHELIRREILPPNWEPGSPMVVKYVDDLLGTETLYIPAGKTHMSTKKQRTSIYAKRSEELISQITEKAAVVGLKVNGKKHKWFVSPPHPLLPLPRI